MCPSVSRTGDSAVPRASQQSRSPRNPSETDSLPPDQKPAAVESQPMPGQGKLLGSQALSAASCMLALPQGTEALQRCASLDHCCHSKPIDFHR